MTRKIVAYKIVNLLPFNFGDIDLEHDLDNDWQPYGNPVYVPKHSVYVQHSDLTFDQQDTFVQAMVVYEDEADQ